MVRSKHKPLLLAAACAFLLAGVYFLFVRPGRDGNQINTGFPLSVKSADSLVVLALSGYGLPSSAMSERQTKLFRRKKVTHARRIELPANVPLSPFLHDVADAFSNAGAAIRFRDTLGGKTAYCVLAGADYTARYEFSNGQAPRTVFSAHFLLSDFSQLDDSEKTKILDTEFPLGVVLAPAEAAMRLIPLLQNYSADYVVRIGDDIEELTFRLGPGLPQKIVSASAFALLKAFPGASGFLLDTESDLAKSREFENAKKIFRRNGKEVFSEKQIRLLPQFENADEAFNYLSRFTESGSGEGLFETDFRTYRIIREALPRLWKRGFVQARFVSAAPAIKVPQASKQ